MPALNQFGPRSWLDTIGRVLFLLVLVLPSAARAEEIVRPDVLLNTENAVFLNNGRYFVAGSAGIHEVKKEPDARPQCWKDTAKGLTVCTVLPPQLQGDVCLYTGMTTDGERLYAACTVAGASPLDVLIPPKAALVRVSPAGDDYDVTVSYLAEPTWYNGMAMLGTGTLLASRSASGALTNVPGPAIDRIDIVDANALAIRVRPWLSASPSYLMPNGIVVDDGYAYFIGGQNLFRIRIRSDGSAGTPVLLHQTAPNHVFDDLTVAGEYLAVAEIAILNGLGVNSITLVRKAGSLFARRIPTGMIQMSSLAVDPGTIGATGDLIATSFFQGGIHRFDKPR